MEKEYEIGNLVILKGRKNGHGRIIDIRNSRNKTIRVGYKVPYRGKLFLQTQWVNKSNLELYKPNKKCSILRKILKYMVAWLRWVHIY